MARSKSKPARRLADTVAPPHIVADMQPTVLWWSIPLIVLVGAMLRIWAARDAFWLDEIWSLDELALFADSPWKIFTSMPESNNHHMYTLWMYICGARQGWLIYRIPAFVAGVGTIVLSCQIARRWGNAAAFFVAVLSASSFMLLTYASEARGYSLAGCFSLAAFLMLDRYLRTGTWPWAAGFGGLVVMSLVSHLTALVFYAGASVWSLVVIGRSAAPFGQKFRRLVHCHVVAIAGIAMFYLVSLRDYEVGGAPPYVLSETIAQTLALALGVADTEMPEVLFAVSLVALAVGAAAIVRLRRERDYVWIFFATTVFIAPGLLISTRPSALFERFFYVSVVFYLIMLGQYLARLYQAASWRRVIALGALAIVVSANARLTYHFLNHGRGQYLAAIQFIEANTAGRRVDVQSDHDFRNLLVLRFYLARSQPRRGWEYHYQDSLPAQSPEWLITHGFGSDYRPAPSVVDVQGSRYTLQRHFPYSGLSGFHWSVYQRE